MNSTSATTPRIPLELQELIVEMADDSNYGILRTATLRSCALTCRAWVARSMQCLYSHLDLQDIRQTQLRKLVERIDESSRVSGAIRELRVGVVPFRINSVVHPEASLLILAGKLPRLTLLNIHGGTISSFPTRIPKLAGFPVLTTLELYSVTFTSYGGFQRMLATTTTLRRLFVREIIWESTHSSSIQYPTLRSPPLTHLKWYGNEAFDSHAMSYLMRNTTVRDSLEYLSFVFWAYDVELWAKHMIFSFQDDPSFDSADLPSLSTLRLSVQFLTDISSGSLDLQTPMRSLLSLAAALFARSRARRLKRLLFELSYLPSTSGLTAFIDPTPVPSALHAIEYLLPALEGVAPEFEDALASHGWGRLKSVAFHFEERESSRCPSPEEAYLLILALRAVMAETFPGLHRRGLLEVGLRTWDPRLERMSDWVEDGIGGVESIPHVDSRFD